MQWLQSDADKDNDYRWWYTLFILPVARNSPSKAYDHKNNQPTTHGHSSFFILQDEDECDLIQCFIAVEQKLIRVWQCSTL